jgi:hypothetical protein
MGVEEDKVKPTRRSRDGNLRQAFAFLVPEGLALALDHQLLRLLTFCVISLLMFRRNPQLLST